VAASGGYWLACAADEIYAAGRTSLLGSIGVVTEYLAYKKAMDKVGIESRAYTAGTSKRRMGPYTDVNEKDVAWLQAHLAEVHEMFKDWIKERRGNRLTKTGEELDNTVFNGDVWHAEKAKALGLIDGIGMMDGTLKSKFGADVSIHRVAQPKGGLLTQIFSRAAANQHISAPQAEAVAEALVEATRRAVKEEALWGPYTMR
jgi:ClpP class serine protease